LFGAAMSNVLYLESWVLCWVRRKVLFGLTTGSVIGNSGSRSRGCGGSDGDDGTGR
jgi:hypothetical protein